MTVLAGIRHGTASAYVNHKCRCAVCKAHNTERKRRIRTAKVAADTPHGTYNGYLNYQCRCRPCTDANAAHRRDWRAARKAVSA